MKKYIYFVMFFTVVFRFGLAAAGVENQDE
jgi:hypothetical protein